jgi:hypothetical protein
MGSRIRRPNRPSLLEWAYQITEATFRWMHPLIKRIGYERTTRWLTPIERLSKRMFFDCKMCGQCELHATGMVCPMTCPKNLRNGACGGVRSDGGCEVIPDMKCVWVVAYERAKEMRVFGQEIISIKPPVNHQLHGTSAWINLLNGTDKATPVGWTELPHSPVIEKKL